MTSVDDIPEEVIDSIRRSINKELSKCIPPSILSIPMGDRHATDVTVMEAMRVSTMKALNLPSRYIGTSCVLPSPMKMLMPGVSHE